MDIDSSIYNIFFNVQNIILFAALPGVLSVTVLLISEMFKPTSPLRNPFYIFIFLFTIFYSFAAFDWAIVFINVLPTEIQNVYSLLVLRYYTLVVGIWNTGVCLNRVTAIVYPVKHGQIWSRTMTTIVALLFFVYPAAFQIPFLQNECWKSIETTACMAYQNLNMYIVAISVIGHALLDLVLIGMALGVARSKGWTTTRSAEEKLIIQTLVTSVLLICVGITKMIAMQNYFYGDLVRHRTLSTIGTILLTFYSYVVIGGLFLASPTFRQKYIEFYSCKTIVRARAMYGSSIYAKSPMFKIDRVRRNT